MEKKMHVSVDELAAIVSVPWRDGKRFTFDRIQTWHADGVMRAVFFDAKEGERLGVPLRPEVEPLFALVGRLARELVEDRKALATAMSVKVQFIDGEAAARVTPEQANAYMRRTGWERIASGRRWSEWSLRDEHVEVPARPEFRDYPRRMGDLVRTLADVEQRSPIAVLIDLLAEVP